MVLEKEPGPLPGEAMTDSHTGVTRGTGTGGIGTVTVTLEVVDGWIMELTVHAPPGYPDPDVFDYIVDEYIFLVYTTNLVNIIPSCCSPGATEFGMEIITVVIQAAEDALAKNKAGNAWHVTPLYKADRVTLVSGTAAGSAAGSGHGGFTPLTVQLEAELGYIRQVTVSGGNETRGQAAFTAIPPRMAAQNSVVVDNVSGATETSLAIREAAGKALQALID
jgi:uncharacterized protein with FMN-binding domain